jgi:hypothetical protein
VRAARRARAPPRGGARRARGRGRELAKGWASLMRPCAPPPPRRAARKAVVCAASAKKLSLSGAAAAAAALVASPAFALVRFAGGWPGRAQPRRRAARRAAAAAQGGARAARGPAGRARGTPRVGTAPAAREISSAGGWCRRIPAPDRRARWPATAGKFPSDARSRACRRWTTA